jgi:hypothetical protein
MNKPHQKPRSPRPGRHSGIEVPAIFRLPQPAAAAVLALLVSFVYANSLGGKFVFDDTAIVQGNESLQGLGSAHLKAIFGQHYWKAVESRGGLYRPLVMLSYAVNYSVGGEDPTGYHLVNVLLHAVNGILVFFLLENLFSRRPLSFLAALLFVLHPIRTEGVASIVGRAESLSTCFALAAWLLYVRHKKSGRHLLLWLSAAVFLLAVLSKESTFAFVALLPLTDYLLRKGTLKEEFLNRSAFARYLPFVLATGLTLLLRYWVLGGLAPLYINPRSNPLAQVSAWPRFLTATGVFWRYFGLLVWPVNLSADYSLNQIPLVASIVSMSAILPLLLLLVLVGGSAASFRRYPVLFFSGFVFFSSFLLTSNWIQPIGTIMGERLMYFPALGFNCAVAFLLYSGLSDPRWRTFCCVVAGALVLGYGVRTIGRNRDWRDHYSLFGSAVETSPGSSLVQSNYAAVLLNEKNDPRGAIVHARKAVEIMPGDPAAHYTLGQAHHRLGDLRGAAEALEAVVRLAPDTSGGAAALREKAEIEEAVGDFAKARASYERLREWQPSNVAACLALTRVYWRLGEVDRARGTLEACRKLAPEDRRVKQALNEYGVVR